MLTILKRDNIVKETFAVVVIYSQVVGYKKINNVHAELFVFATSVLNCFIYPSSLPCFVWTDEQDIDIQIPW